MFNVLAKSIDETEKILYDEIGNPTTYLGANMWWRGRKLTSYRKDGVDLLFTYDASGLRGSKTVGSVKTTYQYVGGKLYYENRGNGKELYYFYDSFGNLSAISYFNGTDHKMYYTLTNSYGDVLGIYDAWGKKVAAYDYDAWGNATVYKVTQNENGNNVHSAPASTDADHISVVNPIRYRGYYYDSDLKLYYLQSRYYDSTVGRFINADGYVTTDVSVPLAYNMFAYCMNNPVNAADPNGYFVTFLLGCIATVSALVSIATATLVISASVNSVVNKNNYKSINAQTNRKYTEEQATDEINNVLSKYDSNADHLDNGKIRINNSKNVTSRKDRQYISTIISKTEGFEGSSASSLSAEWTAHNVGYYVTCVIPIRDYNEKCKDVDLARVPDNRPVIKECAVFCEVFGWE